MRDLLARLEEWKDRVGTDDAKEAYYRAIAAYQLLKPEHAEAALSMLEGARNSAAQCASALPETQRAGWTEAFERCREALQAEIERLLPAGKPTSERVRRVSDTEFALPCAACGEVAIRWKRGRSDWAKEEGLVYAGLIVGMHHELRHLAPLFDLLAEGKLAAADLYARDNLGMSEGMDGYCPGCDRAYCRRHYATEVRFDDGFYDCTYATCPAGHRRMIDD